MIPSAVRLLAASSLVLLAACGSSEPAATAAPAVADIVTPADLPVARRNEGTLPGGTPVRVVIGTSEMQVDGTRVLGLERGVIPEASLSAGIIPELALPLQSHHGGNVVLRLHTNVRYSTLLSVLRTLAHEQIANVGFEVRKGLGADAGLLVLESATVRDTTTEPVAFEGGYQREWADFVRVWDECYTRCAVDTALQCTGVPEHAAEGGKAEIGLFTRQDAFVIDVRRFGTDDPPAEPLPMLPPQVGTRDEDREIRIPPATRGSFWFRRPATQVQPDSPFALVLRPLCSQTACGIRFSAAPETTVAQVLVFLGAAFPNGTPAPRVVFDTQGR